MEPFVMSVDIDFVDNNDGDDGDDVGDEKPIMEINLKKRKATDEGENVEVERNDSDVNVEGFGDDEHKSEKQEQYLPLEGGLAGLITNLSGVRIQ